MVKNRDLVEYTKSFVNENGEEHIIKGTYDLQSQSAPEIFQGLEHVIKQASYVSLEVVIDGQTHQLKSVTAPRKSSQDSKQSTQPLTNEESKLFEYLRAFRWNLAQEKGIPAAFMILPDATLKALATYRPLTEEGFALIPGIGPKKLKEYSQIFINALQQYITEHQLSANIKTETVKNNKAPSKNHQFKLHPTVQESLNLYQSGLSVQEIALQRGLQETTIEGHLSKAIEARVHIDWERIISKEQVEYITSIVKKLSDAKVIFIKEYFDSQGEDISYGILKIVKALNATDAITSK